MGDENHNDTQAVKVDVEIKKASQDIPDVSTVDETVSGKKDGKIDGLSDKMEIRTDSASAEFLFPVSYNSLGHFTGGKNVKICRIC